MAFHSIEDLGTTRRRKLTPQGRLQVWERTRGVCVVCGRQIDPLREGWIAEHVRPLELGGNDSLDNMGPAHMACARHKARLDHTRAAQAKRRKIRHIGAHSSRRPLPFGRNSHLQRKLTGKIVSRPLRGRPNRTKPRGSP